MNVKPLMNYYLRFVKPVVNNLKNLMAPLNLREQLMKFSNYKGVCRAAPGSAINPLLFQDPLAKCQVKAPIVLLPLSSPGLRSRRPCPPHAEVAPDQDCLSCWLWTQVPVQLTLGLGAVIVTDTWTGDNVSTTETWAGDNVSTSETWAMGW